MNAAVVIVIAVAAVVVLGAHRVRHRSPDAPTSVAPARSARETVVATRPRDGRRSTTPVGATAERVEAERCRRPRSAPDSHRSADTGARAVDAARSRGARRQPPPVLQPGHVSLMGAGLGTFAAAGFVAFLWPTATGGFGGKVPRRQARRHQRRHPRRQRLLLRPRGPRLDHRVPGRRAAEGRDGLPAGPAPRHASRASSCMYQKCPHLGCRVPQCVTASGSSARATGRSTTGSARRRAARRRAAWTTSPLTIAAGGDVVDRHRHDRAPGRRSAPTPPARRPRARTASPVAASTDDDRPRHHVRSPG